jgi:hypothetical protein
MMQGPPKHQVCAFLLKSKDSIYHLRCFFRACFQCNNEPRLSGISLPFSHSTFVLVLRPSSFVAWRIQTSLFSFPHYHQRSACGTLVQQRLQIGTQSIFLRVPESEGNISFKECILYPKFWIRGSLTQIAAEQHQRHRSGDTASISKFPGESLSSFETILVSR